MAQSLKSPVGVPLYWESGPNPPQEWPSWLSTFKLAVMAKENLHVDQLLRLKPTAADLFYPTVPSYEDVIEGTHEEETRKRQIRNERRRVDWENECRAIRNRGPMLDRYTWDDADIKVKSLVYLSLGTEASRIYHQRNPHTLIDRCSTNELIYELGITFTRPRNITFDRFQLITVQQNSYENLGNFLQQVTRTPGSKATPGNVDPIKDLFNAKMNNSAIQMELLSEVRTPAQVLNFALSRERGQENQKETQHRSKQTAPNHGHKQAHNDNNKHKTYNRAGDVEHHSRKDITSTIQPKEHNVTSVKRWDILQNYVDQRCQNVPDRDHLNEHYNNHTINPQGTTKQDVFDM